MIQKEAFAKHGFKDDVELKVGVDQFEFKFKYDPTKQIKLKYKGEVLTLTKELIENLNFYNMTQEMLVSVWQCFLKVKSK